MFDWATIIFLSAEMPIMILYLIIQHQREYKPVITVKPYRGFSLPPLKRGVGLSSGFKIPELKVPHIQETEIQAAGQHDPLDEAHLFLAMGRKKQAKAFLEKYLTTHPGNPEAMALLRGEPVPQTHFGSPTQAAHVSEHPETLNVERIYIMPLANKLLGILVCGWFSAFFFTPVVMAWLIPWPSLNFIWVVILGAVLGVSGIVYGIKAWTIQIRINPERVTESWAFGSATVAIKDIVDFGLTYRKYDDNELLRITTQQKTISMMKFYPFRCIESMIAEIKKNPLFKGTETTRYPYPNIKGF